MADSVESSVPPAEEEGSATAVVEVEGAETLSEPEEAQEEGIPATLLDEARNGDVEACIALLDKGSAVDFTDEDGNTALICAARNGHGAVCTTLLDKGAAADLTDKDGNTALIWAARNGHAAVCRTLLENGADVDVVLNEDGNTALICAARNGHVAVCTALLDYYASVYLPNENGDTALICAARNGHEAVCTVLLGKGAAVKIRNMDGDTALICAAESGHAAVCTVLLDKGAAVDFKNKSGKTALQLAEASGHTATADAIRPAALLQGQKQLRESASSGNLAAVKDVLGMAGLNVDAVDKDGKTALIRAARKGHAAVCTALLEKGAAVDLTNKDGDTALICAARNGHAAVCTTLLYKGARVDLTDEWGRTALQVAKSGRSTAAAAEAIRQGIQLRSQEKALRQAARKSDMTTVARVLGMAGINMDAANEVGDTALICGARKGYVEVCTALLDKGAAVDFKNKAGNTALICAARNGHAAVCTVLLDKGAAVELTDKEDGNTALIWAARNGHAAVCRALLDNGAAAELPDKDGNTALIWAACIDHAAVCTALLDNGAAVDFTDKNGDTALICAALNGHEAVCVTLLDNGADVDFKNLNGNTALICAACCGHAAVCTTLLGKGAAVELTDKSGKTALQLAEASGHTATADAIRLAALLQGQKQLRESASSGNVVAVKDVLGMAGLNGDAVDEDGNTALICAAHNGHAAVCTTLLDKGAAVQLTDKHGNSALAHAVAKGHMETADLVLRVLCERMGPSCAESAPEWTLATALERAQKQQQQQSPPVVEQSRSCPQLLRHLGLVQYLRSATQPSSAAAAAAADPASDVTAATAAADAPPIPPPSASSTTPPVPPTAPASSADPAVVSTVADSAAAALQLGRQLQQLLDGAVPAVAESQPDVVARALDTVKQFDSAQEALFQLGDAEGCRQDACASAIEARDAAAATARDRVEPMIPKLTEARDWWAGRRRALQQILERVTEIQAVVGVGGGGQAVQDGENGEVGGEGDNGDVCMDVDRSSDGKEEDNERDNEGDKEEVEEEEGDKEAVNEKDNEGDKEEVEEEEEGEEEGEEETKEEVLEGIQEEGAAAATGVTLPALASGPTSAGAGLDSAWAGYRVACAALIGQQDAAMGLGLGEVGIVTGATTESAAAKIPVLARLLSSATATEAAEMEQGRVASELVVRMRVAEEEALHVAGQLQRVAVKQTRACAETVRRELAGVTKSEARSEAALARATNALGRVTKFLSAQATEAEVCGALQAALERRYEAEDGVDDLSRAVSRARERHRLATVSDLEPKLAEATAELRSILRSTQYRSALAAARDVLLHLPELALNFPVLDPFRGTAAQGLQERDFSEYVDVEPLVYEGGGVTSGRHLILKASCPADLEGGEGKVDGEGGDANRWCVLKGFAVADEKRLRRELHALSCLSHPNIIPLRGICRQRDPTRYFVELPYYPHNLQQWLVARYEVQESKEERNLAVTGVLKGVLEGLEYLHQHGVLHRDLKPENILVTAEGTPVIADFETSLSSLGTPSDVTTTVTRTFVSSGYSPPEVLNEGHSQASDMYSFGLVVAQALLGLRVPPAEILAAVHDGSVKDGEDGASGGRSNCSDGLLDEEQQGVLKRLLSPEAGQRPSAASLLHSSTLLRVRRVRTCVICLADDIPLSDGLECGGGSGCGGEQGAAAAHFTCKSCFSTYITSQSEEELQKLERRGGEVLCPKRLSSECASPAYSDAEVAALCSPEVFAVYVGQRVRLAESQLASEMERDHAKKLEAELARLREMDERTRRVETMAARLRELLNNACPRCKAVFVDFDACSALTCHRCNAAFCAWCLADCGNDAHPHVRNCNMNPGRELFGTEEQWLQSCRRRFRADVTALLDGLVERGEASIAAEVAGVVTHELEDLQIGDIVGIYTVGTS